MCAERYVFLLPALYCTSPGIVERNFGPLTWLLEERWAGVLKDGSDPLLGWVLIDSLFFTVHLGVSLYHVLDDHDVDYGMYLEGIVVAERDRPRLWGRDEISNSYFWRSNIKFRGCTTAPCSLNTTARTHRAPTISYLNPYRKSRVNNSSIGPDARSNECCKTYLHVADCLTAFSRL